MPLIALPRRQIARRSAITAIAVGVAASLFVATVLNPFAASIVGNGLSEAIGGVKTVAAMLAERSPGERPGGALANLKPKRQAVLSDRLPNSPGISPSAYETLSGPPTIPPIAPPVEATPLYNLMGGGTPVAVPAEAAVIPASPGGPPILSNLPLPGGPGGGGGGGGIFTPPVTTATPEVPAVPATPLPEPATWVMIICGFALIGRAVRRRPVAAAT